MPKKRSRIQKQRAKYHYAMPAGHSFSGASTEDKAGLVQITEPLLKVHNDVIKLYAYDPRFIINDLRWTITATVIILGLLIGTYWWLR